MSRYRFNPPVPTNPKLREIWYQRERGDWENEKLRAMLKVKWWRFIFNRSANR